MPKEILPKFSIFHFKMQIFPFRRIDLIPLRGASHNKDKIMWLNNLNDHGGFYCFLLTVEFIFYIFTHLSLQAPVHSTWPQGLRTRIRRSILPRKLTYIPHSHRQTRILTLVIDTWANEVKRSTDLLQASDWVGVALHKLLESNSLHIKGTCDLFWYNNGMLSHQVD